MELSKECKNIAEAYVKASEELKNIGYDSKAGGTGFSYKYASLAHILNETKPILAKHEIAVSQESHEDEQGRQITETLLMHKTGEWMKTKTSVRHPDSTNPQDSGKAITYSRRYGYCAALNIVSEEDNDCNDIEPRKKETVKKLRVNMKLARTHIESMESKEDLRECFKDHMNRYIVSEQEKEELVSMCEARKEFILKPKEALKDFEDTITEPKG